MLFLVKKILIKCLNYPLQEIDFIDKINSMQLHHLAKLAHPCSIAHVILQINIDINIWFGLKRN